MIIYYLIKYIEPSNYLIKKKISKLIYGDCFGVGKVLCYLYIMVNNY